MCGRAGAYAPLRGVTQSVQKNAAHAWGPQAGKWRTDPAMQSPSATVHGITYFVGDFVRLRDRLPAVHGGAGDADENDADTVVIGKILRFAHEVCCANRASTRRAGGGGARWKMLSRASNDASAQPAPSGPVCHVPSPSSAVMSRPASPWHWPSLCTCAWARRRMTVAFTSTVTWGQ